MQREVDFYLIKKVCYEFILLEVDKNIIIYIKKCSTVKIEFFSSKML